MRLSILLLPIFAAAAIAQNTNYIASPFAFDPQTSTGTQTPFLIFNNQAPSVRYQQVYDNSDFHRFVTGSQMITEITFSTGAGFLDTTLANVQMNLSTTLREPDALSSIFSENVGPDNTVVFSGALHLFATGFERFGVHIPLQQPFLYNPDVGNLLLDVRNFQTMAPVFQQTLLLASGTLGDTSSQAGALDVNSDTALLGTGALFTQFTVTAVPEPSSVVLFLLGAGSFGLAGWRTRAARVSRPLDEQERKAG